MKKNLLILAVVYTINNTAIYAQIENYGHAEITLKASERKEPINKGNGPITRSITQTTYAYIYNNVMYIGFNKELSTVTICIIKESNGETVYIETFNAPTCTSIDLNGEDDGNYSITIEFDDTSLYGTFVL